jgi:hypothetical protein
MERQAVEYNTNKMNNKKRAIDDREGLERNEEEVYDLRVVENIE